MSENLLNKRLHGKLTSCRKRKKAERRDYNWRMLALLPAWVAAAFIASNVIVAGALYLMDWLHMPLSSFVRPAILQTVIATLIYALTIGIVIGVPYLVRGKLTTTLETLGLQRLIFWSDIGLAPVTFLAYTLTATALLAVITQLIPGFPANQSQDVGFNAFGSQTDNILAFMTLVVLAPIAEETLFRGYLYGKLLRYVPAVVAALATSLIFGIAHMQWNVSIDVFILSMFLCGLRSLTGSIWAGILVHMIKNGIAYYILFVSPLLGR